MTIANSTDIFGPPRWIVDPTAGSGTHTTIGAAITAASSGQNIFIRPGTYTENPALKAGVNLVGFVGDSITPQVIINGKCTFSSAGTVTISNIQLETNSDFALAVTGSAASKVYLEACYLNCLNNTGISFTTANTAALVQLDDCQANLATTGIGYFSCSSTGTLNIYDGDFFNTGTSLTASTVSGGPMNLYGTEFAAPITTSSSGTILIIGSYLSATNTTVLTIGGGGSNALNSSFNSGTATAIVINNGLALTNSIVTSSNTNAISGSGTLFYGANVFNSGQGVSVSVQTSLPIGPSITTPSISFGGSSLSTYQTGTWTPTMIGSSTAGTATYTTQAGTYTQIGNLVWVTCNVAGTTGTGTAGNFLISGLPVNANTTTNFSNLMTAAGSTNISLTAGNTQLYVQAGQTSATTASLVQWGSTKSASLYTIAASTQYGIQFAGVYHT